MIERRHPLRLLPVVESVDAQVTLDPYLSTPAAARYLGISVRTLRNRLEDPRDPVPAYQLGGRLLFRLSELDRWMAPHRRRPRADVAAIVADVLGPRHPLTAPARGGT